MSRWLCGLLVMTVIFISAGHVRADVLGVIGMNPVEQSSCIAVQVPLDDNEALAGIEWFNNDGTALYPEVRVCAGFPDEPGLLADGTVVGVAVGGGSSDWSGDEWTADYGADEFVYVVFVMPEGSVWIGEGDGGGAAVGYVMRIRGCRAG